MAKARIPGAERMRALALDLPRHLLDGFQTARELSETPRTARRVVVTGMGGSAIAADLAANLTDPETEVALSVSRGPGLPQGVGRDCWSIFASYSGETWETLRAYEEAGLRGGPRAVVSSGGELAQRADRDGVPHLPLPPGLPPRAAVGYLFGGLLGLLDPFFAESNESRLGDAAEAARALGIRASAPGSPADRCAAELEGRIPYLYTDVGFSGLARRWKTQLEENAKQLAHFDLMPELFHNALVAWDALPIRDGPGRAVVFLEWSEAPPAARWGFDYLEKLLRSRRVPVGRIPLTSEDRLGAIVEGIVLGDHVSLHLADRRGIDPLPVDAIRRLKESQGKGGPGARPPTGNARAPTRKASPPRRRG